MNENKLEDIKSVAIFMIEIIAKNKSTAIGEHGTNWDWVAAQVWNVYPGIVNEFLINDAIDFLYEAMEHEE
jgi:hypothetical protein